MRSHSILVGVLAFVLVIPVIWGAPASTLAREATPAAETVVLALPLTPDPAKCAAEELPLAEMQAIYDEVNAASATAAATPAPFVEQQGEPADAATVVGVTETVVEVIRCNANGGSGLADAFYLTEEHLRESLTGMTPEDFAIYTAKTPLSPEEWLTVYAVRNAQVLPDGRVAANPEIIVPGVGHFRDTLIFEQVDGRWLIDESHEGEDIYPRD